MTDRIRQFPHVEPIRSHDHALKTLGDTPYLAYTLVQTAKFLTALLVKRWPNLK